MNQKIKKEFFYIEGMTCTACSGGIERALKRKPYIQNIQVDLLNHSAIVEFDETQGSLKDIFTQLTKMGYHPKKQGAIEKIDQTLLTPKRRITLAILFTLLTLYLSMFSMLPYYQLLTPIPPALNATLQLIFTLIVMHFGRKFYFQGFKALFALHPTMDTLVALGSGSAFVFSCFEFISLLLHDAYSFDFSLIHTQYHLYFEGICVILLFILLGKSIEEKAKDNAKHSLQALATLQDAHTTKVLDNKEYSIPLSVIQVGDILKISPQENIPTDGVIISGYANIDNSSLSGESLPIHKKEGENINSGALNLNTTFLMRANKKAQDSTYWQILDLVQNAILQKAPIAQFADKVSLFFVPFVIVLALICGITWFVLTQDFYLSLQTFCNILLISCPCALGLATPLAINIATKLSAQKGIFFKNAHFLELVAKTSLIFFDKTGTLTQKQFKLKEIQTFDSKTPQEILQICASLECNSEHIIAQSILQIAQEQNISLLPAQEISIQEGLGLQGKIGDNIYKIGNAKNFSPKPQNPHEGITVFIGQENKILGCILLEEKIKDEALQTIEKLKTQKIKSIILSGDRQENVEKIGNLLNISFIADALPQDKLKAIENAKDEITMMVGDGINDILALSQAQISVSMGEGNQATIASSDLVIFNNNLCNIPYAIALSKATLKNIKQNLTWAFGYNLCMIPIACGLLSHYGIMLSPALASIAMTFSSLSVVLNAQRLKKFKG